MSVRIDVSDQDLLRLADEQCFDAVEDAVWAELERIEEETDE